MADKNLAMASAKTDELKRRIAQTFALSNVEALRGLPDRLTTLGHPSIALALEQLLETEDKPLA